jgi:hypothetical protein
MSLDAEIQLAAVSIADLGTQIERHREAVLKLVEGKIATDRSGSKFKIDHVRVYAGGMSYRFFFEGPKLRKDGTPHSRTRGSSPLELLLRLSG